MSGHSKWNNIKGKKAVTDAKKGKDFGYAARLIRVAVKEGKSGDPNTNAALRTALDKAKEVNLPKENIDRAIERGLGRSKSGAIIEEISYEGYGPGGVGFIVTALTDNRNRTGGEIRTLFDRNGGSLAGPGAAAYLFEFVAGEPTVKIPMDVAEENDYNAVLNLAEVLEANDDVESVWHNMTLKSE